MGMVLPFYNDSLSLQAFVRVFGLSFLCACFPRAKKYRLFCTLQWGKKFHVTHLRLSAAYREVTQQDGRVKKTANLV